MNLNRIAEQCPLCGRPPVTWSTIPRFRIHADPKEAVRIGFDEVEFITCSCGTIYALEYMDDEQLEEFYQAAYRESRECFESVVTAENLEHEKLRADLIMGRITDIQEVNSALDVGCSTGELSRHLHDRYGCAVKGVEINSSFRRYAEAHDVPCVPELKDLPVHEKFDLVTMIHVLEHIPDFMPFLMQAVDVATDWLVIDVPLVQFSIPHPVVFSESTFLRALSIAGLNLQDLVENVKVNKYGNELHELIAVLRR